MTTLELIKFKDVLRVTEIPGLVPNAPVPTVVLKGEDFSSASIVEINDVPVSEFILVNANVIWAELPVGVSQVRTVAVLSDKFTITTRASRVLFQVGNKSNTVSGLAKLVQNFTKILLQSPGSDIFDPDLGGGLQDLVGSILSTSRADQALSGISQAVARTSDQIRKIQRDTPRIPIQEKLLSARLVDINTIVSLDEARARIQIENVAGESGITAVGL